MSSTSPRPPGGMAGTDLKRNRLLAALLDEVAAEWRPQVDVRGLKMGDVLHEPGASLHYIYFPLSCVVSVMQMLSNGDSAQVAVVGREGLVGATIFLAGGQSRTRFVVQSEGDVARLPADLVIAEFAKGGAVMQLLLRHTQAVIAQMAQTAACNRYHTPEQQLCRWLLMTLDRVDESEVSATQELVGSMLGVRRETISETARKLQAKGIIQLSRCHVRVLDRAGLEQHACECYATVAREYARLITRSD